jgi:hypothetical protein
LNTVRKTNRKSSREARRELEMVEHLPSMYKALGSILDSRKKWGRLNPSREGSWEELGVTEDSYG